MITPEDYIETVYGTAKLAHLLEQKDAYGIFCLMNDYKNKATDELSADFRKELIRVAFELEKVSKRYPKMNTADVIMMFRRLAK